MSDTQPTPTDHIEVEAAEERRTFHYKMLPGVAKKAAIYARRNGMHIGATVERAIELLISTTSPRKS